MLRKLMNAGLLTLLLCGCKRNEDHLKIYFAGDLLLDRGVREQIHRDSVAPLFRYVKTPFLMADAVVANLECPVTKRIAPVNKKYIFRGEPEWLPELKRAGVTHLVMANNHTCDQGRAGMTDTRDNLVASGLVPIGYGATQDDACSPVIIQKGKLKVAVFSSVLVTLENWSYLADSPGICQATVEDLVHRVGTFREHNKDCRIVVFLHWGVEFRSTPMPVQTMQAEQLIDAGADAIVGCHPHVVQPYTVYEGKPIFYSIGNFVFDQQQPEASKGELVLFTFTQDSMKFSALPFAIRDCVPVLW